MTLGFYGGGGYGSDPYGSIPAQIGVLNATALNGTHVQVNFTELLDFTFPAILSPANYSITLTIISVEQTAENAVVLTTTPQSDITYTVTVASARSSLGTTLNPLQNSAQFTGFPLVPGYFAIATASTRVRAIFSSVMLNDSNLSNPANYTITDFNGNAVFVIAATPEQSINPVSVVLTLASPLGESDFYVCTVSANIHTALGLNVLPPTSVFQWLQGDNQLTVPLRLFSGESSSLGPVQDFAGLVYFSPALNVSTANSIIQVEEIDVCTTAYDTYTPPVMIDSIVLYTYGGGIVPTPSPDPYLLNQCVLWAPWPRNFEAQIIVEFTGPANNDLYGGADDTSCSVTIAQQYALGYVALLNDPAYYLLPKNSAEQSVPPMFITAKNHLSPIPPGSETILVLHVSMRGTSFMPGPVVDGVVPPMNAKKIGGMSADMPGTSQLFAGAGPPPVVLAQASMAGGSTMSATFDEIRGAFATLQGQAFLSALPTEGGQLPTVLFGTSLLTAIPSVRRAVASSIAASSAITAHATAGRGVGAAIPGSSNVAALASAHWKAHAAIAGTSAVFADATVVHHAEAFPVGIATVTASPT